MINLASRLNLDIKTMFELGTVGKYLTHLKEASDDLTDRAHYYVTTALLLFFASVLGASQIFGMPIHCIIGAQFPGGWSDYVNSYCLVTRTYLSSSFANEVMPDKIVPEEERIDVSYYQWIPYIMVVQAAFFYIPHFFWNISQTLSDVDFNFIIQKCVKARKKTGDDSKEILEQVVNDITQTLKCRHHRGCYGDGLGNFGGILYCVSKLLNVLNLIGQIMFLNHFVGHSRADWGLELLHNSLSMSAPSTFNRSNVDDFFPRVSFCTFRYNKLGTTTPNEETVQCLLMTNMLNEKIYLLFYVWFYLLLAASITNLIYTLMRIVSSVGVYQSHVYLQVHNVHEDLSAKFISEKFGLDGLLLLHFIKNHAGFSTASEIAHMLYEKECKNISKNTKTTMTIGNSYDHENGPFLAKRGRVPEMSYV